MILHHGSSVIVQHPEIMKSSRTLDFGYGFYTTTSHDQAYKWARIKANRDATPSGFISIYEVDDRILSESSLHSHSFRGASSEWLRFVINNRMKDGFAHTYDVVRGAVANDRVYACLNAFENRFMSFEMAIQELRTYKLDDQVSFHTAKALSYLHFINSEEVTL
ncbi:MAG: DUF3990 domain-containing protein [Clostridia bacterium]